MVDRIGASIEAGETWMVRDDQHHTAATVALDTFADPNLWTPEEIKQPGKLPHNRLGSIERGPGAGPPEHDRWSVSARRVTVVDLI